MTCREMVEFLMDYLEGELPAEPRDTFEEHMRRCPPCVAYLESYRRTIALGKAACSEPEGPVPDDVPEELIRAILASRQS
ncbi:MAG: anti-sigma factor family protein [Myxococcota bacterium]